MGKESDAPPVVPPPEASTPQRGLIEVYLFQKGGLSFNNSAVHGWERISKKSGEDVNVLLINSIILRFVL